jgi:UDP-N-acetylglucosamine--N-acetylmuramyl-(pentapeptide) pyrophosphoryl-undecaprenol N-acetylglucosamine transferase
MSNKILILSGGTGGHVIPSINFGNFLIENGYECSLILDERGQKYSEIFNGKVKIIKSAHFSGNYFFKIKSIINLLIGLVQSLILIINIKPNKCLSFGSYATSMPLVVILFLRLFMKIKIYLHEQNSVIGKVNLLFLPYAECIFTNFDFVKNLQKKELNKKYYVGLPSDIRRPSNTKVFNKSKDKKIIFIYGGSQGSVPLINNFLLLLKDLDQSYYKNINLIIQSPEKIIHNLRKNLKKLNIDCEISEFYNNIEEILSQTNFAFTRAGSGTINDLIKYNVPAMIMPLPYSIYNHQYYNAKYLSDINGAILIDEVNFNINIKNNVNTLKKIISTNYLETTMKEALDKIILPNANQSMLTKMLYEKSE